MMISAYYNGQYRNKYGPTNVLSFDDYKCGQIILCVPIIEVEAESKESDLDKYWAFMLFMVLYIYVLTMNMMRML